MEDKKKILLVFIVAIFLVLIVSATYAYFAVSTINNFGTSTINAQAGGIGTVTLNGNNAQLNLSVTALDMVQGSNDITYYASSSGTTTTETEETIGTATLTPNTDTTTYHCTYTLSVTHTGTNDMYTAFTNGANKSAGQIILTINGVDYDFYNGWPANNRVTGEFNIKGNQTVNITAGLRFLNKSSINQNYLAGTDLNITINVVNGTLSCEVVDVPTLTLLTDTGTTGLSTGDVVRVAKNGMENQDFYVVSTDASETVLLAKYNLMVGNSVLSKNKCDDYGVDCWDEFQITSLSSNSSYGLQSADAVGYTSFEVTAVGVVPFSDTNYWYSGGLKSEYANSANVAGKTGNFSTPYPNVYDSSMANVDFVLNVNNNYDDIYNYTPVDDGYHKYDLANNGYTIAYYVEGYVNRLGISGTGRLLTNEEALSLASTNSSIIYNGTRYWLGSVSGQYNVRYVYNNTITNNRYSNFRAVCVRPVIEVNTSDIIV